MAKEPEIKSETSDMDQSVGDEDDKSRVAKWSFLTHQMLQTPAPVSRRIKALKQLQLTIINVESRFYQELHELEAKYYKEHLQYYDKRAKIITGEYEPTDEECIVESDDDEECLANKVQEKVKIEGDENAKPEPEDAEKKKEEEENIKGIPDFWLTIFKNVQMLSEMVQPYDEPILKHLYDIKVEYLDTGFKLEFHFSPNKYFTNSVLTKEYIINFQPEEKDPFSYEGPEIVRTKGCVIDWKKGKNVTLKVVKKNQKHRSEGSTRTVTKTVQSDSFFNYFNPPNAPEGIDEIDEDIQDILNADFEIGHYIRDRIIQRAVLYYTGEALEDDDDEEEEENEEEEEDEDDDDDDIDDLEGGNDSIKRNIQENTAECKQQ